MNETVGNYCHWLFIGFLAYLFSLYLLWEHFVLQWRRQIDQDNDQYLSSMEGQTGQNLAMIKAECDIMASHWKYMHENQHWAIRPYKHPEIMQLLKSENSLIPTKEPGFFNTSRMNYPENCPLCTYIMNNGRQWSVRSE